MRLEFVRAWLPTFWSFKSSFSNFDRPSLKFSNLLASVVKQIIIVFLASNALNRLGFLKRFVNLRKVWWHRTISLEAPLEDSILRPNGKDKVHVSIDSELVCMLKMTLETLSRWHCHSPHKVVVNFHRSFSTTAENELVVGSNKEVK